MHFSACPRRSRRSISAFAVTNLHDDRPPLDFERPAPFVKSPLSSFRPSPSSARTPSSPSRSSLSIARSTIPRSCENFSGSAGSRIPDLHHPVQHLPVVHPDQVVPARDPHGLQRIRQHRADLGIRRHARRAHRVRVALGRTAGTAPAPASRSATPAPSRSGDRASAGRSGAAHRPAPAAPSGRSAARASRPLPSRRRRPRSGGPRRGGTCPAPRPSPRPRLQRLEPIQPVHPRDPVEHLGPLGHLRAEIVAEALGRFRLRAPLFSVLRHGSGPRLIPREALADGGQRGKAVVCLIWRSEKDDTTARTWGERRSAWVMNCS
jgi:hypothetical protein